MFQEYLWACSLTGSNKEFTWDPANMEPKTEEEKEGPKMKTSHVLQIKTAMLMTTAKKGEITLVELETEGYNKQPVILKFFYLGLVLTLHCRSLFQSVP